MATIPLTRGMVAIVDDADYEWLSKFSWHARLNTSNGVYYAARTTEKIRGQNQKTVRMQGCASIHIANFQRLAVR
jgi:hypothetical protein